MTSRHWSWQPRSTDWSRQLCQRWLARLPSNSNTRTPTFLVRPRASPSWKNQSSRICSWCGKLRFWCISREKWSTTYTRTFAKRVTTWARRRLCCSNRSSTTKNQGRYYSLNSENVLHYPDRHHFAGSGADSHNNKGGEEQAVRKQQSPSRQQHRY